MIAADKRTLELSIRRAIEFLARRQLPHGEFQVNVSLDPDLGESAPDSSPFVTALVLYAIGFVNHPLVIALRERALNFLVEEMEGPGLWRYWSSRSPKRIDPDLDDTCCISQVLRRHHPHIAFDSNLPIILTNRNDDGLFRTWFREPGARNDVDSVVNANALFYLGERSETRSACLYLNRIVLTDGEAGSSWYYLGPMPLYYAMSRASSHGVTALLESRDAIVHKILSIYQSGGGFGNDLERAFALCSLLNLRCDDEEVLHEIVHDVVNRQMDSGAWERVAAWTGPEPPERHSVWWGSEELTTAVTLEALAKCAFRINFEEG
jgi:hypothetical protein